MALYRYRPKGNRTPVNDPVLGHLCYEGEYDDPRCADDARFEEIKEDAQASSTDDAAAAKAPEAGKTGRSKA